jgi:hypothetical protein
MFNPKKYYIEKAGQGQITSGKWSGESKDGTIILEQD